jgi:transposase
MTRREQDLEEKLAQVEEKLAQVMARNEELEVLVKKLQGLLGKNSRNSSKPPSSDVNRPKKAAEKGSGAARGAQPGHPKYERKRVPADKVDQVIDLVPSHCFACESPLKGIDKHPQIHQVVEIPPIVATVTEYRRHALTCSTCQARTRQPLPVEVTPGCFGARLSAMMVIASAKYRLSKRLVKEMLGDFLNISLCIGSIAKTEQRVSAALEDAYQEAATHVRNQPVVHADETGWRENKSRAWLWVAATQLVSLFYIASGRGRRAAQHLLGEMFSGILVTDRWSAYGFVPSTRRQLCWAHLLRDFQAWVDRDTSGSIQGRRLLALSKVMFSGWHRLQHHQLSRRQFQLQMAPLKAKMLRVLRGA